jgi:hypothetical protein
MKKMLIGALVGGLILFIWQFLSWSMLNVHGANNKHTANQDAILEALAENLEEDGMYFLPNVAPGASQEEYQEAMKDFDGKPWAQINYHSSFSNNMTMNMIRGYTIDFLSVLLLCWILLQFSNLTFTNALLSSLAVGFIGYLTVNYLNSIWYEQSTIGDLIDVIVGWGLTGSWLGWWLRRA